MNYNRRWKRSWPMSGPDGGGEDHADHDVAETEGAEAEDELVLEVDVLGYAGGHGGEVRRAWRRGKGGWLRA